MKNILLHGLGQSAASWDDMINSLGETADLLCPELSGWLKHGAAHYDSLYEGLENDCARFDSPLNLCGLSLGGILALQYGIEHPDRANSLILIGTQYVMPKGLLKVQNAVFRLMPKRTFQAMGFEKGDFIDLCSSMLDLNFQARLHQIRCPVLLVCGEKDKANKAASVQMKAQIPNAELLIVPGAGHEVNRDAPEALGKAIDTFWRDHA